MSANNQGTSYADLWRMHKEQEEYKDEWTVIHQRQILEIMDLPKYLPILSWKAQLEVLDNAPMPIIEKHAHLLHDRARKTLGLEEGRKVAKKEFSYFNLF